MLAGFERRGDNLKGSKDFYLKDKAIIWPWLSDVCHIRSTSDLHSGGGRPRNRRSHQPSRSEQSNDFRR